MASSKRPARATKENKAGRASPATPDATSSGSAPRDADEAAQVGSAPSAWPAVALVGVAMSVAFVIALFAVDYLPTNDGPQHVFLGHLENHYADADKGYETFFAYGHPATELGFSTLFSLLEGMMPWRAALRVTLAVIGVVFGSGFLALVTSLDRRRWALGALGFAAAFQWPLYMGFFDFVLALGLGFFILAFAVSRDGVWRPLHRALFALMLLFAALVHVFPTVLIGLTLLLLAVFSTRPSERRREIVATVLSGAPAAGLALLVSTGAEEHGATRFLGAGDLAVLWPRFFLPASPALAWLLLALGLAAFALRRAQAAPLERTPRDRLLGLVGAVCVIVSFVAPLNLASWQFFSPRFIGFGVLLLVAAVPLESIVDRWRGPVLGAIVLASLGSLAQARALNVSLRTRASDALAGLDAPLRRSGARMPVVMDPFLGARSSREDLVPMMSPVATVGQLYAVAHGGAPFYTFASNPLLHGFVTTESKPFPPAPDRRLLNRDNAADFADPAERRALVDYLASYGTEVEDVILVGTPDDVEVFRARGFSEDFRQGGAWIGRFTGCPARVVLAAPAGRVSRLALEYGWYPSKEPSAQLMAERRGDDLVVELPKAPCGEVWFRLGVERASRTDDAAPGCGAARALGAGVWLTSFSERDRELRCELGAAP